MPIETVDDLTRRLCLLYPWSKECQGVGPMVPTDAERASMFHAPGGYEVAQSTASIPPGSQCESVQLIPVGAIGSKFGSTPVGYETQLPTVMHSQFPQPTVSDSSQLVQPIVFADVFSSKLKGRISEFI